MKKLLACLFLAAVLAAGAWFVVFPARHAPVVRSVPPPVTSRTGSSSLGSAVQDALVRYVSQMRRATGAPGVSAAVVLPDGEAVTAAVGYADVEARTPMAPDTLLLGGSTGKSYGAATIMRLVAAGRLSVDDRVSRYLGARGWFARVPNPGALTIRMLLTHTGGLPQFLDLGVFQRRFLRDAWLGRDTGYPPETMLSFLSGEHPLCAPGAEFHYSDLGYTLLGLVIEQVTGRPYFQVLRDEVLAPLDLDWIRPADTPTIPGLAVGYVGSTWLTRLSRMAGRNMTSGVLRFNPAIEYTGGGLANNPRGLATFYKRLIEGRLVDARSVARMVGDAVPAPALGKGTRYGYGLMIMNRPMLGRYIGHSGWYPGYLSYAAYFADHGFSVAIQVNRDDGIDIYVPVRDIASRVVAALDQSPASGPQPATR